ncbi:MAG: squalene synthase HpnC [Acidimicrobiales bacterium]|jgi:squalene synthase HpnC
MNVPVELGAARKAAPAGLDTAVLMAQAGAENFPVALRLLPGRIRDQLLAIYGYARFVDDVGDRVAGDRLAQLNWVESELDRALAGAATHPVFVRAGQLANELGVGRGPFADFIEANRRDQLVTRYATYEALEEYCTLSANPVGRLVLAVFGRYDEPTQELSDQVCTALQLIEHCQDVAEDLAEGRLYLPQEDLARFGVDESLIAEGHATPAFRRLMAFELARARRLLSAGRPLVASLSGWARVTVAGFVGGGCAQLVAIDRRGYDVLSAPVKARRFQVTSCAVRVYTTARRDRP